MVKSLRSRFLLILLSIAAIALSGTILLRTLMIRDFTHYLEGEAEDRASAIAAHLEGSYERNDGWKEAPQAEDALWALNLGFELRLQDKSGRPVMTTRKAVESASPLARRRLETLPVPGSPGGDDSFVPYPLFLRGIQIGMVELRELRPARPGVYIRRSDLFLLLSIFVIGALAVFLSLFFSRRLTEPIRELALASSAISRGDFTRRVSRITRDEVGDLSEAFNRMAGHLETQQSLRRKLVADVAHELRTPLTVMRAEMEAMIDGVLPIDVERLQSLYDETGRLKNMVGAIEELNRAEASILSLDRRNFPAEPFLVNIVERFRGPSQEKRVTLDLVCTGEPVIYGDPDRVSQIVINLLSNALRATEGGGRVSVEGGVEGEYVAIRVADTGSGIKEEDLPFVFERFYHGRGGGLGIGLTIVKELAEAHGGQAGVESAAGTGSTFTVLLPRGEIHNSS